ncbi:MAG: hypothetical protein M5U01_26790 [Ardenticatenaceae bacterium]|nr:hypothetical protein [Ardenticatenaceae bacterium]
MDFRLEEQKQRLLVPTIQGKKIGTIAMTEAGAGSDVGRAAQRAA